MKNNNEEKKLRPTLPGSSIWTVEDLAKYMGNSPSRVQDALTKAGIKTLRLGIRYSHRFVRLEDLRPMMKEE